MGNSFGHLFRITTWGESHGGGVGVVIDATHECMTTRGIHKRGVSMVTSRMTGTFREDARTRMEFLQFVDIRAAKEVY